MLHIHVLLVTPLGAGHMAQPGTDQHEGGVAVREAAHHHFSQSHSGHADTDALDGQVIQRFANAKELFADLGV